MKVLKIIGIIILILLVLGLGVVVFGPTEVNMERQITIDAPVEEVFKEVNGFKTFDRYSSWYELDTAAQIVVEGPATGVGAKYSWAGNSSVGKGSIEIIESDKNMMVKSKMNFEGIPGEPTASWLLAEEEGNTTVTYTYSQSNISGIWKMFSLATESMLGPMYDKTLAKLKTRIESRPNFTYEIEQVETEAQPYIGAKASSSIDPTEIGEAMSGGFGAAMAYVSSNDIEMTGAPISIVLSYDEASTEMICGIPTSELIVVEDENIISDYTYAGLAVKTIHKGDYDLMESAYNDLMDYMSYYGFEPNGSPWEVYVTDPSIVTDTAKWMTEIYFPVQ